MRFLALSLMFGLVFLSGCAMQRAQDAETAQRVMVGMTKEQVFACMGLPKRKGAEGATEIWSYESGNHRKDKTKTTGTVKDGSILDSLTGTIGLSDEVETSRFCTVQIVMTDGLVKTVNYNGPTGGFLTDDEQCAYATRNCLPK